MSTFLDVKTAVTGQLGGVDAATYVAKRETAINRARRRYYSSHPWEFLLKPGVTQAFVAGIGTIPTDMNVKLVPRGLYYYSGYLKYEFDKVAWSDVPSYATDSYVYAVDAQGRRFKTNHPEIASLTLDYYYLPADYASTTGGDDSTVEPAPDTSAIEFLSIGYWWLAKERDEDKFKIFEQRFLSQLREDTKAEAATEPVRFFRPARRRPQFGYVSRN